MTVTYQFFLFFALFGRISHFFRIFLAFAFLFIVFLLCFLFLLHFAGKQMILLNHRIWLVAVKINISFQRFIFAFDFLICLSNSYPHK